MLNKILRFCFVVNIVFILVHLGQIILFFVDINTFFNVFTNPENRLTVNLVLYFFFIPSLFLWIYNIRFLFKYDRYSKSIFPLLFFNFAYSPFYYYQVKIKGRPLKNEIKKEPVLGRSIQLEEYENESDFQNDLLDLEEK